MARYTVKQDETWQSIANKLKLDRQSLISKNASIQTLYPGIVLDVPAVSPSPQGYGHPDDPFPEPPPIVPEEPDVPVWEDPDYWDPIQPPYIPPEEPKPKPKPPEEPDFWDPIQPPYIPPQPPPEIPEFFEPIQPPPVQVQPLQPQVPPQQPLVALTGAPMAEAPQPVAPIVNLTGAPGIEQVPPVQQPTILERIQQFFQPAAPEQPAQPGGGAPILPGQIVPPTLEFPPILNLVENVLENIAGRRESPIFPGVIDTPNWLGDFLNRFIPEPEYDQRGLRRQFRRRGPRRSPYGLPYGYPVPPAQHYTQEVYGPGALTYSPTGPQPPQTLPAAYEGIFSPEIQARFPTLTQQLMDPNSPASQMLATGGYHSSIVDYLIAERGIWPMWMSRADQQKLGISDQMMIDLGYEWDGWTWTKKRDPIQAAGLPTGGGGGGGGPIIRRRGGGGGRGRAPTSARDYYRLPREGTPGFRSAVQRRGTPGGRGFTPFGPGSPGFVNLGQEATRRGVTPTGRQTRSGSLGLVNWRI